MKRFLAFVKLKFSSFLASIENMVAGGLGAITKHDLLFLRTLLSRCI